MNKKIVFVIGVVILFFIAYIFCFTKKEVVVDEVIDNYLSNIGIKNYRVYQISDYKGIEYTNIEYEISQEDIDAYIKDDLESREKNIPVKDRDYVKSGDVVTVSYTVYLGEETVNYVANDSFMVGKGKYNSQIESNIIGKRKNQEIIFNIQVPKDDKNKKFAGKTETVKLYVNSINTVQSYELNKSFVSKFYGFDTLGEYYDYVKKELSEKNTVISDSVEDAEINSKLIKCFKYVLSEEEVAEYSLNIIKEYEQQAYIYNLSLEEYREDLLGLTEYEFMQKCYNEGEERIKKFIAMGVISKIENISISAQESSIDMKANELIIKTLDFLKKNYFVVKER